MEKVFIQDEDYHRELLPQLVMCLTNQNLADYLEHHEKNPEKWKNEIELLKAEITRRDGKNNI